MVKKVHLSLDISYRFMSMILIVLLIAVFSYAGTVYIDNGALNITSDFFVGSDDFFVNTTSGYVGINTTTPSSELDVVGDVNITGDVNATSINGWGLSGTGISCTGTSATTVAACPTGYTVVGGGCSCSSSVYLIRTSYINSNGWSCSCKHYSTAASDPGPTAYARCCKLS